MRVVAGAMQANAAIANAYVADITPPEQRAKRFGLLGAIHLQLPFFAAGALAMIGLVSVVVQGLLLGPLLKRFSPQRLAVMGLISSALAFALWGLATEGWMMYAIIGVNEVFGATVAASVQSLISVAADSRSQGQTLGAVSSLNSLMAVLAPMLATPLLALVSHYPQGDWRIGAPFYFCSALQVASLGLAILHFRRHRSRLKASSHGPG